MSFLTNDKVNEEATSTSQNSETFATLEPDFIDVGEAESANTIDATDSMEEDREDREETREEVKYENMSNSTPSFQKPRDMSILQLVAKYKNFYEGLVEYSGQLLKKSPKCCLCRDEQSDCTFLARTKCNTYDTCLYDALNEAITNMARVEEVILRLQEEVGYEDRGFEVSW